MTTVHDAIALCTKMDSTWNAGPDYMTEEVLMSVGRLNGGLSVAGFARDINDIFDKIEDEHLSSAGPYEFIRSRGGNDPHTYVSDRLQLAIDAEQEAYAAKFLASARALLRPLSHVALEVA